MIGWKWEKHPLRLQRDSACATNVCTNACIPSHESPSRNTAVFEGGGVCLHGSAHIRQYHRVFLNLYYGSRRTCVPLSGRSRALTRPRESGKDREGSRRGEKRERIQFLGCILKSADLSTATRANIVDGKVNELRVFLFVCPLWPSTLFVLFPHSFYIRRKWDAFHLVADFLAGRYVGRLDRVWSTDARVSEKRYILINNINTTHVCGTSRLGGKSRLNWIRTRYYIFGYAPPDSFNLLRSRSNFCVSLCNHQS